MYEDQETAVTEPPTAPRASLPGEGFHNFPYDYSASEYRWHVNFTTFFIDRMAALGLTYDWNSVQGQDQKHWRWELQE